LIIVLKLVIKEKLPRVTIRDISVILRGDQLDLDKLQHPYYRRTNILFVSLILVYFGLLLFNIGLEFGLTRLGVDSGGAAPVLFLAVDGFKNSPLFRYGLGLFLALVFGFILGFGATIAEPALNVMGMQVEDLSHGKFTKRTLTYTVSFGVGVGILLGLVKITKNYDIIYFILVSYGIALILTIISSEEYANVAWDSAGVTTGAVTVPLVMALGLAFGDAVKAIEGFGILTMASVGPIISVLTVGLFVQNKKFFGRFTRLIRKREQEHLLATVK